MRKALSITFILFVTLASCQEEVVYYDDFTGESLNMNVWSYQNGDGCPDLCGWGNNEKQTYRAANLSLRDGHLVINTTLEGDTYFSSKITTQDKLEFKYGTIEVRAMLPAGTGIWPAIWLLGSNIDEVGWPLCGEIDMMEFAGKDPDKIHTTMHTQDSHGASKNTAFAKAEQVSTAFHTYKLVWTEEKMDFFIDKEKVYTFNPEERTEEIWPFDQPFYLIINTAVGGTFAGKEVDDSIFPQEFVIDYIKITQ